MGGIIMDEDGGKFQITELMVLKKHVMRAAFVSATTNNQSIEVKEKLPSVPGFKQDKLTPPRRRPHDFLAGNLDVFTAAAASLIFRPFYTNHMANLADGPPCINNKSPAVIYLGQHAGEGIKI
ncbi:hypothetical protein NC652_011472 [Populus alba x Populus x berolinensis]|nr:hypothetical protein NC652_011472 [Populus alba x Populus x berolinensis]